MCIWSFIVNGLQVCKTATKAQFRKELEEYTLEQVKEIERTVRFTKL